VEKGQERRGTNDPLGSAQRSQETSFRLAKNAYLTWSFWPSGKVYYIVKLKTIFD
jgi:hypothetical protein